MSGFEHDLDLRLGLAVQHAIEENRGEATERDFRWSATRRVPSDTPPATGLLRVTNVRLSPDLMIALGVARRYAAQEGRTAPTTGDLLLVLDGVVASDSVPSRIPEEVASAVATLCTRSEQVSRHPEFEDIQWTIAEFITTAIERGNTTNLADLAAACVQVAEESLMKPSPAPAGSTDADWASLQVAKHLSLMPK